MSHIPLARPDSALCGPFREKGTVRRGVGHGYQMTLGKQTTAFLLQTLRPSAVFRFVSMQMYVFGASDILLAATTEITATTCISVPRIVIPVPKARPSVK